MGIRWVKEGNEDTFWNISQWKTPRKTLTKQETCSLRLPLFPMLDASIGTIVKSYWTNSGGEAPYILFVYNTYIKNTRWFLLSSPICYVISQGKSVKTHPNNIYYYYIGLHFGSIFYRSFSNRSEALLIHIDMIFIIKYYVIDFPRKKGQDLSLLLYMIWYI